MSKIDQIDFLKDYFSSDRINGTIEEFLFDALILIILSLGLGFIYMWMGTSLSNRKKFASIFPLLSLTTMMIISIIRSSLALSLGLVGALSIIRFRSAIKEPEELAYIFLTVSLGLGFGAGQREITIIFFLIIATMLIIKHLFSHKFSLFNVKTDQNLYLNISISDKKLDLKGIVKILDQNCHFIDLKRVDEKQKDQELLFLIKTKNLENLVKIKDDLRKLEPTILVTILNDEGLFS